MHREKRFRKVAVLMGGPSLEREISLASGRAVAEGLRQSGYDVSEIDVRRREFQLPPGTEAVFIALHGEFGEDGSAQAILEQKGVPYTGSGPEASRRSFDKLLSKETFEANDIPVPPYAVLGGMEESPLDFPVVLKPPRQGSSIGVHRVFVPEEWEGALRDTLRYDGSAIVEKYIEGREITVGIVGETVMPPLEIRAPGGEYSFRAKYTRGVTEYLVPAPLEEKQTEMLKETARRAFEALGCRGFGRVDMRLSEAGEIFVLEMNTIPGFTQTSLLPKAAAAMGIGFAELCDRIISDAELS